VDDLGTWADKAAITEVIHRFARGLDRADEDLLREVFHPGATDDHGVFAGSAEDFVAWVLPVMRAMASSHHLIGNVLIEVEGDRAFAESYFRAHQRLARDGAVHTTLTTGRYLDRLTRIDGTWAIVHRRTIFDANTALPPEADRPAPGTAQGRPDREDPSYTDRDAWLG
jgi:ketosteroid isomerase-like protein